MSRFYDVLKEASRSQPPNGKLGSAVPETATEFFEEIPQPGEPAAPAPESVAEAAPAPVQVAKRKLETLRNGSGPSRAFLDRNARLIPNAADPSIVEHYRRLRTKLLQENEVKPFRVLMIASPNPQEGKTLTAMNLALSFAMLQSYKVLIIDGDLRKGTLSKWLSTDNQLGLSNLVDGSAEIDDVILKCDDGPLHFVQRGNSKMPAGELLNSPRLHGYLRQMSEQFDLVLVDSPPLNLVTDAQLLAQSCDGVLVVARAFSTTRKGLEKALQDLQSFRVLGAVLNGGTRLEPYRRYNHYY